MTTASDDPSPLLQRLSPSRALEDVFSEIGGCLTVDFAGIAIRRRDEESFRVLGRFDRRYDGRRKENAVFPVAETAAAWVERTRLPFVGTNIRSVWRFRQTSSDMATHGFASNVVLPLDLGHSCFGILYALSQAPESFSLDSLETLAQVQSVLEPTTTAWMAADRLLHGESPVVEQTAPVTDRMPTLEEAQAAHIELALKRTHGVIDGPNGAAKLLDLKPSTLRSKMRRLGLR